jgi:hypothetical protein
LKEAVDLSSGRLLMNEVQHIAFESKLIVKHWIINTYQESADVGPAVRVTSIYNGLGKKRRTADIHPCYEEH